MMREFTGLVRDVLGYTFDRDAAIILDVGMFHAIELAELVGKRVRVVIEEEACPAGCCVNSSGDQMPCGLKPLCDPIVYQSIYNEEKELAKFVAAKGFRDAMGLDECPVDSFGVAAPNGCQVATPDQLAPVVNGERFADDFYEALAAILSDANAAATLVADPIPETWRDRPSLLG